MRTIKSQNGKMIVNAEKMLGNCAYENDGKWFISVFDTWSDDDKVGFLAEYSTETRALRVLDLLNEWLTMQRTFSSFRMPKDSEELDA